MNKLPIESKKRSQNLFNKIVDSIKLIKDHNEFRKNIAMFKHHPKFSAYNSDYVKFSTYLLYEKNPNLCVFFADGDGLGIANQLAEEKAKEINLEHIKKLGLSDISLLESPITGEQLVDKDIESIILQINNINKKYGYKNALVGIQGDEFFICIPNINNEDIEKIYYEYSNCKSGLITISVGYCNDMKNGIENAFDIAEKQAQQIKLKKKEKNRINILKDNNSAILIEELENMLAQLRIQVDTLTTEQKNILKDNITISFEHALQSSEDIFTDIKNMNFSIYERICTLDSDLDNSYSCSVLPEQRNNFILSQVLTRTPLKNIQKLDFFIKKGSVNLISSNKKKTYKNLHNNNLVNIEISGIKDINDTFGHSKCDQMIYETLNNVNSLINKSGIKLNSPIFAHNISCYGFLVSEEYSYILDELISKISSMDSDFKLAASYSKLGENINKKTYNFLLNNHSKTSIDVLNFLLLNAYNINNLKNKSITCDKKINDKFSIYRYISKNFKKTYKSFGQKLNLELLNNCLNYILKINTLIEEDKDVIHT